MNNYQPKSTAIEEMVLKKEEKLELLFNQINRVRAKPINEIANWTDWDNSFSKAGEGDGSFGKWGK